MIKVIGKHMIAALAITATAAFTTMPAAQAAPATPKAKISIPQAEAAAVKKVAGTAQSAKYEFEDGHWQYAVIVKDKKGQLHEVEVNSTTGKVLATEVTTPADEAKEAAADKKAAAKHSTMKAHKP